MCNSHTKLWILGYFILGGRNYSEMASQHFFFNFPGLWFLNVGLRHAASIQILGFHYFHGNHHGWAMHHFHTQVWGTTQIEQLLKRCFRLYLPHNLRNLKMLNLPYQVLSILEIFGIAVGWSIRVQSGHDTRQVLQLCTLGSHPFWRRRVKQ